MMRRLIGFRTGPGFYDNIGIFQGDAMDLQTRLVHEHEGVKEFLEELIKRECLEPAALGITKKVIAEGIESLTTNQRYVFDNYVVGEFATAKCEKCQSPVLWSEMLEAYDNGGYCAHCWGVRQKLEKE
jgi:hypothetical protein